MTSSLRVPLAAFVFGVAWWVTGCGGGGGGGGSGGGSGISCTPDLPTIEQTIFTPSCALSNCHIGGTNAAGSLDLSGDTAAALIGVASATCQGETLVVPGDAKGSLLYQKVAGTQKCGGTMPLIGKLPGNQIDCIAAWIAGLTAGTGGAAGTTGTGGTAGSGGGAGCEMCGGSACVDLATDPAHCGACDKACAPGETCAGNACQCAGGGTSCNGDCVDVTTSAAHCGGCDIACGAGQTCVEGACQCAGGVAPCKGVCVDLQTDEKNCGVCGNACALGQTCVAGACMCGAASVSFSAAVQPILTASCATNGCHKGVMPAEGLNLTSGQSYAKLVNVTASQCADGRKRVLPGQPSQSYLIDKLMGVDLCFGTQMPKQGMIPQAQIQTISDWICGGALNN
ncbi:MAG: hypothetical protein U0441_21100 [Polyangiaceae bacterium]